MYEWLLAVAVQNVILPSSEADIRGGSPGSRQVKCFSVPLVGMDVSGAVLMCVKYKHTAVSNDPR